MLRLKPGITLEEFKFIWHMEYGHRMWGRLIGATFVIPAAFFWSKGYLNSALKKRVLLFGTLIGFQVFVKPSSFGCLNVNILNYAYLGSFGMVHGKIWTRRQIQGRVRCP